MSRKSKFSIGSLLIISAIGLLLYSAVEETSSYFLTMEEYAAASNQHRGKPLRLAGRVSGDSVDWNPRTLDLVFVIQPIPEKDGLHADRVPVVLPEGAATNLTVEYNGILPDMFAEGRDVIVEGTVENGVFEANTLLTTCPSKYEAELTEDPAGSKPAVAKGETAL